ncbi:chaplin [Streptomyces sp. MS06]|uniref:chaplin n=1 Tax=Streptomyces sp. MS06 TaxID=3385974 RepID=UPI0039A0FD98
MRRVTRIGVIAVAASGALTAAMPVHAALAAGDGSTAGATSVGSPGVVSGNTVQLPVNIPANVCGNTVSLAGLLNPAFGNDCATTGDSHAGPAHGGSAAGSGTRAGGGATRSGTDVRGATHAHGGSRTRGGTQALGSALDAPGVVSGNAVHLPVESPLNVSGNTVNAGGLLNPVMGNRATNAEGGHPAEPAPEHPAAPPQAPPRARPAPAAPPRETVATLASTGADATLPAALGSIGLILGGAVLYRRFRPGREG